MTDSEDIDFESADEGDSGLKSTKSSVEKREDEKSSELNVEETVTDDIKEDTLDHSDVAVEDTTQPVTKSLDTNVLPLLDKLSCDECSSQKSSGWGSWGSWGASLVSTATSSVAVFTNQVGEGLNAVLENVDGVLGIPSAEEMAKQQSAEENDVKQSDSKTSEENAESSSAHDGLLSSLSSLSSMIERSGSTVINTSLDTLEHIGKKTMDMLQERDPGLRKKRAILFPEKPTLSEVLKEAKAQSELNITTNERKENVVNYHVLFDEYQGLVHLEALEMLSRQQQDRLVVILPVNLNDECKSEMEYITETCNLDDFNDSTAADEFDFDKMFLQRVAKEFQHVNTSKFKKVESSSQDYLTALEANTDDSVAPQYIYETAVKTLAEFTAVSMEFLHKLAEMLLIDKNYKHNEVDSVASAITTLCMTVNQMSTKFSECLQKYGKSSCEDDGEKINALTTQVFLEASNSSTYIQDALQLMIPIFQLLLLESDDSGKDD